MIHVYFLQDYEKLSSFVANNYDTKLEKVDLSVKGWNWGVAKFEGRAGAGELSIFKVFTVTFNSIYLELRKNI